jgi:hypothetical protein
MPLLYDKLGVRFQYPDNWTLDEDEAQATRSSVTTYSPDGAFWSITVHPDSAEPAELAKAAVKAMREVYEQLDAEPEEDLEVAGFDAEGFELNFYCLDLTNTAIVRAFRGGSASYVVFCQAEDREYVRLAPVFEAMTQSLQVRD